MKKPSEHDIQQKELREKLLGFGEDSLRKSYYPELQRQLENLQEQVELARLVADIARGLAEEEDLQSSLQRCTDSLVQRTSAVFSRIWTADTKDEFLLLQASSGLHTNLVGKHSRINIKSFPYKIGLIARTKKPLHTNEVSGNPSFHDQEWVRQHNIVSFVGYPLILENKLVGVVAIFANTPLQSNFLNTISTIVSQIAVGIKRKRAEIELADYKDKLELLVQERTLQLKEAQNEVLQNERLATLGRLTATVSHELRNPLGTIQTAVFSLDDSLERNDFSHTKRALELVERNIVRCVKIIDNLTDFTRVKKLALTEARVDEWLRNTLVELDIPKDIHCEENLTSDVIATFDTEKMRQVIVNLINNAVDAIRDNPNRQGRLKISTRQFDEKYEVTVNDNGSGMTDDVLKDIFTPLYSTKGFGVGLGMVIVNNIIEQHKGEILIDSKAGAGTSITLRLPRELP